VKKQTFWLAIIDINYYIGIPAKRVNVFLEITIKGLSGWQMQEIYG
jgi:hypothetical protein